MVGQIRELDPVNRQALIALEDGRQVTVTMVPGANIEVREPTTMGTMGGTLEDLRPGYWVEVDLREEAGAACACSSLVCIS